MDQNFVDRDIDPAHAVALSRWRALQGQVARVVPPLSLVDRYRAYVLPFLYVGSAVRNFPILCRLWNAPRESALQRMLQARPEIWRMLRVRYVSTRWGSHERLTRIIEHCDLVEQIGRPFDLWPQEAATLLALDEIAPGLRLVLDSPRWLVREGLLALSLMQGSDRIFALSFSLSEQHGRRVAYVGGIQGRRAEDALERNRMLTRGAAGARPQDLLFELFRTLCSSIGVNAILCVSNGIRSGQTAFVKRDNGGVDPVKFDYDALWLERGGRLRLDGFFDLPIHPEPRDESEVPAKKRAARRKKLAFIADLQDRLTVMILRPHRIRIDQVEPI